MIRIKHFTGVPGLYSFTDTFEGASRKIAEGLNAILRIGSICIQYIASSADGTAGAATASFNLNQEEQSVFAGYQDDDVLEINEQGVIYDRYTHGLDDCTIYISSCCNSNCIMCPISESERAHDAITPLPELLNFARYIPPAVEHVTITGGEPFLLGQDLFQLLNYLREHLPATRFQLLTNGRVFADRDYAERFAATSPRYMTLGIPIHGSDAERHDTITQSEGSFHQTVLGIRHLLRYGERIEVRFVVSRLNADDITAMAQMIIRDIPDVSSVKIMGLEMLGNAATHQDQVWIGYREAFAASEKAAVLLMQNGIDVEFYNFPLCMVDSQYWGIYRRSISEYKIRYKDECSGCIEKSNCGGFFAGTIRLVDRVYPIASEV